MLCLAHGRPIFRCGRCCPKKLWPKGYKACRCGELIDRSWPKCASCLAFETEDWVEDGISSRRATHSMITQIRERG